MVDSVCKSDPLKSMVEKEEDETSHVDKDEKSHVENVTIPVWVKSSSQQDIQSKKSTAQLQKFLKNNAAKEGMHVYACFSFTIIMILDHNIDNIFAGGVGIPLLL